MTRTKDVTAAVERLNESPGHPMEPWQLHWIHQALKARTKGMQVRIALP